MNMRACLPSRLLCQQVNHIELEEPDKICNNGSVISIRGTGRFTFLGFSRKTRTGRIVAEFLQNI